MTEIRLVSLLLSLRSKVQIFIENDKNTKLIINVSVADFIVCDSALENPFEVTVATFTAHSKIVILQFYKDCSII